MIDVSTCMSGFGKWPCAQQPAIVPYLETKDTNFVCCRYILMLFSNLLLEALKTVFNSRFLTKILYTLYLSYELCFRPISHSLCWSQAKTWNNDTPYNVQVLSTFSSSTFDLYLSIPFRNYIIHNYICIFFPRVATSGSSIRKWKITVREDKWISESL